MRTTTNERLTGMLLASALVWVGCVTAHEAEQPELDASGAADAHVGVDAFVAHVEMDAFVERACVAPDEMGCASQGRECCPGSYCQRGVYVLEYDSCVAQAADGERCMDAAECVSGRCDAGLCRMAACVDDGAECFAAYNCCTGFCPAEFSYGSSVCTTPLPAGAHCYSNAWCASQECSEGLCS